MDVRIKFNEESFYKLRSSTKVVSALQNLGENILNEANATLEDGNGYRMSSRQGRKGPSTTGGPGYQGRWAVRIVTASDYAKRSNAKYNTLIRLLNR
jgi:hypothetical protein